MHRSCSAIVAIVAANAVAFVAQDRAAAQVKELDLPAPITSEQFDDWIEWLDLTHEDRIAAEVAHERYKESWRRFRATTLARAWEEIHEETARLRAARQRPLADAFDDLKTRAWREQQGLENALFGEMRVLLPERLIEIEQLELRREWDYIGTGFDLADLARALPLNLDNLKSLDPVLMQARSALVTVGRQFHEQLTFLYGADERALREAGFGDPVLWTREGNEERERVLLEAWQRVEPEIDRLEEEFRQLQLAWARKIEAALPDEVRREYRIAWGSQLYPDVYEDVCFRIDINVRRYRRRTDLTDEQRHEIDALEREFIAANEALELEYMQVWDQLLSLHDDSDGQKKVNERRWQLAKELEDRTQAFRTRLFQAAPDLIDRSFAEEDACLVYAMAPEEFELVRACLGLEGNIYSLARGMYEEYITSADEYIAPFAAQINGTRDSDPRVEAAQRERLRQDVQSGIQALDEQFLSDLFALAAFDAKLSDAVENLRSAERVNPVAQSSTYPRERIIHPVSALAVAEISNVAKRGALLATEPWLDSICADIEQRHGLRIEREHRQAQATFEYNVARDRGEEPVRADTALRDWNELVEQLEDDIAHACLRMHDLIKATLSATEARLYEDEWRKIAYPHYSGGPDATKEIELALSVGGVTSEQVAQLLDVLGEHWEDREDTFHSLISWPPYQGSTIYEELARKEWEETRSPLPYTQYDAIEAAATTLRRVRALLTAEQAAEWEALVAAQRD